MFFIALCVAFQYGTQSKSCYKRMRMNWQNQLMQHLLKKLVAHWSFCSVSRVDQSSLVARNRSDVFTLGIKGWLIKLSSRNQIGCSYAQLPFKCEEIVLHVLSFISAETLAKVRSARHQWMKWASTRQLWKSLACLHWPGMNVLENGGLAGGNFMAYF